MIRALGFHHAALQVRDVERLAGFYRDVLGLPELQRHLRDDGTLRSVWLGVSAGQATAEAGFLAVEAAPTAGPGAQGWSLVALRIAPEARRPVLEALVSLGVVVERQTAWTIYLRDPEANLVALSHHPHDAAPV